MKTSHCRIRMAIKIASNSPAFLSLLIISLHMTYVNSLTTISVPVVTKQFWAGKKNSRSVGFLR
jgi:hypothetical protein